MADFVAEVFCPSECVRLIQDQASMRNVDSRNHSLRFDCCVFLFYSFSAVTFATQSVNSGQTPYLAGWSAGQTVEDEWVFAKVAIAGFSTSPSSNVPADNALGPTSQGRPSSL